MTTLVANVAVPLFLVLFLLKSSSCILFELFLIVLMVVGSLMIFFFCTTWVLEIPSN
jgi:hypothetical protein